MARSERRRLGTALVEVAIVLAIAAIMVAAMVPVIARARASAQQVVCARTMRQWGLAFQIYAFGNKGYLPWAGNSDGNSFDKPIGPWADPAYWANALPPLMNKMPYSEIQLEDMAKGGRVIKAADSHNMFVCPAAGECATAYAGDACVAGVFRMWGNPEGSEPQYNNPPEEAVLPPVQRKVYWSYVMNSKLDNSLPNSPFFITAHHMEPAQRIVLLVEKAMNPAEVMPGYENQSLARGKTTWTRFTTRHFGGGNLLFLDGHVEYKKAAELAAPRGHGYYKGEVPDAVYHRNPAHNVRDQVIWDPNQSPLYP